MLVACTERLSEKIKIDTDFFFLAQFTTPVIQFSDLLLSCQLIFREGEERQLGFVYTWSLYACCRIGYPSDLLLLTT